MEHPRFVFFDFGVIVFNRDSGSNSIICRMNVAEHPCGFGYDSGVGNFLSGLQIFGERGKQQSHRHRELERKRETGLYLYQSMSLLNG